MIPLSTAAILIESDTPTCSTVMPDWFPCSAGAFANFIREIIATWIVSGIVTVIDVIADALQTVTGDLLDVFGLIGSLLILPFSLIADGILAVVGIVDGIIVSLTGVLGLAAPLGVVIGVAIMLLIGAISTRVVIEIVRFI